MAKKKTKRRKPEPLVSLHTGCAMELRFSRRLEKEPETLRRLAHRVVDLIADGGHYEWLSENMAGMLTRVVDDLVVDHMTKLVVEARAEGKEAARG